MFVMNTLDNDSSYARDECSLCVISPYWVWHMSSLLLMSVACEWFALNKRIALLNHTFQNNSQINAKYSQVIVDRL